MRVGHTTRLGNPGTWAATLLTLGSLSASGTWAATSVADLSDLSGQVIAEITRKSSDNFTSELRYEVRARNLTNQAFQADSLIIILDELTNFAGQAFDPVSRQPLINQVEVLGHDGSTTDGKPYFYVPLPGQEEFGPYSKSASVTVRLRNTSFITGLTPSFKVLGQVKKEPPAKRPRTPAAGPAPRQTAPSPEPSIENKFDALIDVLIEKGVLTQDEWRAMFPAEGQPPNQQ